MMKLGWFMKVFFAEKCLFSSWLVSLSNSWTSLLCVFIHIRNGWPGIFLRDLRVPAERSDDEPVLYLRRLPQVPLNLLLALRNIYPHCCSRKTPSQLRLLSLTLSLISCPCLSSSLFLHSGSRLGGIVTTLCFFFNHGEVSEPLLSASQESAASVP